MERVVRALGNLFKFFIILYRKRQDNFISFIGNSYHPSCFTCSHCNKELNGTHFTVDYKNNLYCIEDFHE